MIRSSPTLNDEKLQIIRQISHPNVLESIEIYSEEDNNYYIVSGMIETSLMHVCRAPEYPSEVQLSSILFQVLSGSEYLITQGEVKIGNVEDFQTGGDKKVKGPESSDWSIASRSMVL
ncbi:hypothetical protein Forpi1262_v002101 [Fusarium oxysporum f. sp. raphani]|uniref:Protein kinase domain-containing protein n=1 Tax=Fusarium oxysporum f. sp. raphani TaxID=96318 RepID=A0A8J5UGS6_FUSOX|nr:hypothetical protein Forpi1262_v002101 [Fusarium oxysporum f. sp. raphani]